VNNKNPSQFFYGWYIAVTAFLIYSFTNGMTLFVPQNLFPRFMETFDVTAAQVSRTTAISLGLSAFLAPFIGSVIDRIGVVRFIRSGLAVMAVCFCLYPFATSITDLYIIHAVLAFGFVMAGLMANVVLLSKWFVARRGMAVGFLASGSSLAGAIMPVAISPLVNDVELGWRWGFGALTIGFLVLAVLPGFTLLKESPAEVGCYPDGAPAESDSGPTGQVRDGVSFDVAIKSRTLWCLAIGSACIWFVLQAMNSQVTIFFEREAGLAPQQATVLFSLIFWVSFAGKFLFGAISDYFSKRRVMLVATVTLLCGCLILFNVDAGRFSLTNDINRLRIFAAVFGLGFGGSFTMIQLVCVESFGQRALGKILGSIIFVDSLGAAAGGFITGYLQTATGGYLLPFAAATAVAAIGVINVLFIRPLDP
jgi:sugar phosphate permease